MLQDKQRTKIFLFLQIFQQAQTIIEDTIHYQIKINIHEY